MRCVQISNTNQYDQAEKDTVSRDYQLKNCQFDSLTFVFGVQKNGDLTCSDPSNHVRSCAYQTCECNLDLIKKFSKLRESFDFSNSKFGEGKQCHYQSPKSLDSESDSTDDIFNDSGLSIDGQALRTIGSNSNEDNLHFDFGSDDSDFWSFEDDNKFEDTDYYRVVLD